MSELTQMAEAIHDTLEMLERAQEAGEELRKETNHENYSAFRVQMEELSDHLRQLKTMLAHEDEVAEDELADALSRAFHGQPAEYHHAEGHGK